MPTPKGCPGCWWFVPPLLDLSIWRTVVKIHPRLSPDFTSGSVWLVFRAQVDRKPTLMTWTPTCGWIFSHLSYFTIVEENLLVTLHSSMFSRWGSHSRLLPYLLWSYISNLTRSCSFYMRRMRAIRRSVTSAVFATIVNALTCSRIDECTCTCNTLLMDIPK